MLNIWKKNFRVNKFHKCELVNQNTLAAGRSDMNDIPQLINIEMDGNSSRILIDIPFSSPIITSRASGIILRTVIEFLSYHRKQIPFPYDTYKFMTAKIQRQMTNEGADDEDLLHMRVARQQRLATDTFNCLKTLLENVIQQLETTDCLQALIVFGATSLTAKEAFVVNIPKTTKYHHAANHLEATQNIAKSITMSILTSPKLYEIESKLNATNMFVLLRPRTTKFAENSLFQLNEDFKLPRNCRTVVLNLRNLSNPIQTNCCQHLVVFDDLINECDQLKMIDSDEHKSNEMKVENEQEMKEEDDYSTLNQKIWYESAVFVRGFKDTLVNGKSLWHI